MKRFFAVLALVLLSAGTAFALSDAEYLRMRRNSAAFAKADKKLNQAWAKLRKSLPKNVFAELEEYQHEWIASGRDIEAQSFMNEGYTRVEAYTMATNDRAEALPKLAQDLRRNTNTSRTSSQTPKPESKPKPSDQPVQKPEPEPEPNPEPDVEDDGLESQPLSDPAGEYASDNAFMTVKVLDYGSMEAEVTISRWKDEVSWKASGWIDDGVLELSDSRYSTCQVTITFDPDRARVVPSDSEDWAKATADDFVIRGTYMKKQ